MSGDTLDFATERGILLSGMKPLQPPDSLHLDAAQGWLGLGNHVEANAELEKISPGHKRHAEVLKVKWEICAAARKWEAALESAATLIQLDPEDPLGWVHRSYALHELKRTAEARDNLLRVVDKFPISATMRYNLACYECQLGRLEQAKEWLEKAFQVGDARRMKSAALEDPDLKPLWKHIGLAGS
ncbi:MAG TPA: tetratricopeptide repeat protein [Candidatus Binatia bacterium]|nr:tetratricopeptide repeat protein [Candidatus Binatia bacterium]